MSVFDWIFITAAILTAVPIISMLVLLLLSPCSRPRSELCAEMAGTDGCCGEQSDQPRIG